MIDEDPPHRLRRSEEKVPPVLERTVPRGKHPCIRLVHQRRRLKRVPGPFIRHPDPSHRPQLLIYQRQEFVRRLLVAVLSLIHI